MDNSSLKRCQSNGPTCSRRKLCFNKRRIYCNRNENGRCHTKSYSQDGNVSYAPVKRPRISGPSYYKDREENKVSSLEVLAIQLFTLVLAAFNKNEDVDVAWSFQRLTDAISRENRNLVPFLKRPHNNESSPSDVTSFVADGTHVQGTKLISNASLKKFHNMIFLLLGNSSRAPGLQPAPLQQGLQHTHDKKPPLPSNVQPTPLPSSQQSAITKHLVNIIDLFLKYNLKRKQIFKTPFEVSGMELREYMTILHQVMYQTLENIQSCVSQSEVVDEIVTSTLTKAVSTMEACISIYCNFLELWTTVRDIVREDDKVMVLLERTMTKMQELRNVVGEEAEMARRFQALEQSALSLLHLISTHSNLGNHDTEIR